MISNSHFHILYEEILWIMVEIWLHLFSIPNVIKMLNYMTYTLSMDIIICIPINLWRIINNWYISNFISPPFKWKTMKYTAVVVHFNLC